MPSYTRKSARTMASRRTVSRPRRRSAYATLSRPIRRYALNVSPNSVYKYQQYSYPVTIINGGTAGAITSSNSNVISLGTSVADATISNTWMVGGVITPRLSNCNGASSFQTMYDQFRVRSVRVTVTPLYNSASYAQQIGTALSGITITTPIPELVIARDWDDTIEPQGASMEYELMERQDVQVHRLDSVKSFSMTVKPRIPNITSVTTGGVQSQGIMMGTGKEWIDLTNYTTAYPGFKFVLRYLPIAAGGFFACRVDCKYYIEFKNVR